jgi:hypothetical protein
MLNWFLIRISSGKPTEEVFYMPIHVVYKKARIMIKRGMPSDLLLFPTAD